MESGSPASFRDRPSVLDEHGNRIAVIPAEVVGFYRRWRTRVQWILMVIFLATPWIKINERQAVLLDLKHRELHFWGLRFWAHDGPLVFVLLAGFALALAVATGLFGRVWCGWACPQTVFIDGFVRRIERWIEGNYLARRALEAAPWTLEKILKRSAKWILFFLFSALITHSFVAYFIGSDLLLEVMTQRPEANWALFVFVVFSTGIVLFDIGWFREQFCLIVCPYGRIQSLLMDPQSITVQYDSDRGEPRRGLVKEGAQGDCIDCKRCVQVCPTGIDIRNGLQLECIACTACIDACDEIMAKVKKPEGLIRYKASTPGKPNLFRPRILAYSAVLLLLLLGGLIALWGRHEVHVSVLRALDAPFFVRPSDSGPIVVNSYRVHVHNESGQEVDLSIGFEDPTTFPEAKLQLPTSQMRLKKNEFKMLPIVIEIPQNLLPERQYFPIRLKVQDQAHEVKFVTPSER